MATLTTTISESVQINGATRGSSNTYSVTDIIDTFERVVTCSHSQITTIAEFNTSSDPVKPILASEESPLLILITAVALLGVSMS